MVIRTGSVILVEGRIDAVRGDVIDQQSVVEIVTTTPSASVLGIAQFRPSKDPLARATRPLLLHRKLNGMFLRPLPLAWRTLGGITLNG
jgi:hypothetical protein